MGANTALVPAVPGPGQLPAVPTPSTPAPTIAPPSVGGVTTTTHMPVAAPGATPAVPAVTDKPEFQLPATDDDIPSMGLEKLQQSLKDQRNHIRALTKKLEQQPAADPRAQGALELLDYYGGPAESPIKLFIGHLLVDEKADPKQFWAEVWSKARSRAELLLATAIQTWPDWMYAKAKELGLSFPGEENLPEIDPAEVKEAIPRPLLSVFNALDPEQQAGILGMERRSGVGLLERLAFDPTQAVTQKNAENQTAIGLFEQGVLGQLSQVATTLCHFTGTDADKQRAALYAHAALSWIKSDPSTKPLYDAAAKAISLGEELQATRIQFKLLYDAGQFLEATLKEDADVFADARKFREGQRKEINDSERRTLETTTITTTPAGERAAPGSQAMKDRIAERVRQQRAARQNG